MNSDKCIAPSDRYLTTPLGFSFLVCLIIFLLLQFVSEKLIIDTEVSDILYNLSTSVSLFMYLSKSFYVPQ